MKLFVRLAALLGGTFLYSIAAIEVFPGEDANIGAGLIYFGLLIVASALWGLWDGRQTEVLPPAFVRWTLVAIVIGLATPVSIWSVDGLDFDVLWSDFAFIAPLVAGLVLVPAAAGIAIGHTLSFSARNLPRSTPQESSL